jgi:phage shock protein A
MADEPIDLDTCRGIAAQQATEHRRHSQEVKADRARLEARDAAVEEAFLASRPAVARETLERACYLIRLFASTPEAQDSRRQALIENVLADLGRMTGDE